MKKASVFIAALAVSVLLTGCGSKTDNTASNVSSEKNVSQNTTSKTSAKNISNLWVSDSPEMGYIYELNLMDNGKFTLNFIDSRDGKDNETTLLAEGSYKTNGDSIELNADGNSQNYQYKLNTNSLLLTTDMDGSFFDTYVSNVDNTIPFLVKQ